MYIFFIPDLNKIKKDIDFDSILKNITKLENPLPGTELGVPISIFENIFTKLHYNFKPNIPNIFWLNSLLGYATYGLDRYLDALEYNNTEIKSNVKKSKVVLYEYILENEKSIKISLITTYVILINYFSQTEETSFFLPLLLLSTQYKNIKKNFGGFKSSFIGVMWVISTIILPCVIYENNFNIIDDYQVYLPAFFSLVSSSNLADIKDIEEDKINNVNTIPVLYGKDTAYGFSVATVLLSFFIFLNHPNFHLNIENTLFEISNIGNLYAIYKQRNDTLI